MPAVHKHTRRKIVPRVGDLVRLRFGSGTLRARVIENRGPIGKNGRSIIRVELLNPTPDSPRSFEVPMDDVVTTTAAKKR